MIAITILNHHFGYKMQFITEQCMKITVFTTQKPDWELYSAAVWTQLMKYLPHACYFSLFWPYMHFLDIRVVSILSRSLPSLHLPHCHTALLRYRLLSPAVHLCFCITLIGDCWVTWTSAYVPYLTPIGALLSVHSRQASSEPWVKVGRCSSNLTGKRNYCLRYNLLIRPSRTAAYSPSWERKNTAFHSYLSLTIPTVSR